MWNAFNKNIWFIGEDERCFRKWMNVGRGGGGKRERGILIFVRFQHFLVIKKLDCSSVTLTEICLNVW